MDWTAEIWLRYLELVRESWPRLISLFCFGAALGFVARRLSIRRQRIVELGLVSVAACAGFALVLADAAVFDDAYISFRYARNLIEGHGLVWNPGERVEGYTNFLWTIAIAALAWLMPFEPPELALAGCLVIYAANLTVVYRLSRSLRGEVGRASPALPLAVCLLAVQDVFVSYGTSGLETGLASLLVTLGVASLVHATAPRQFAGASLCFILATLTRPDHALFYVSASIVVASMWLPPAFRARGEARRASWRHAGRHLAAWTAPFGLYAAYVAWKLSYYGQLLPNTYYAKAADESHFVQGLIYAETFYLGSHVWLVLALFVVGTCLPVRGKARRRFGWMSLGSVLFYNAYVLKVGGDFMYGRFYVSLLPMMLIGAELAVGDWLAREGRRPLAVGCLASGLLVATAGGVPLLPPRAMRWHVADESSFYRLTSLFPAEVDHVNYRIGERLGRLQAAGLSPLVATSGIGMLGYNSRLVVLDYVGLVDPVVARQPAVRDRPGHRKIAPSWYIRARNPHFLRSKNHIPARYERLARISFGAGTGGDRWVIYHYDAALMRRVSELIPEARFVDFERYLDRYIARATRRRPAGIDDDLRFFRRYYFDHNNDAVRLRALETLQ